MNVTCLNYHFTNCYLIPAGSQLLMIDADWAGTLPKLFHAMGEAGVRMQDVGYLLVTHYDPDHAGIAQDIKELGIQLVVIDLQVPHMSRPEPIFRKEGRGLYKPLTSDNTSVIACDESRAWLESIGIAGEIIHTPGHTDDSVTLIVDGVGAIVGDLPTLQDVPAYNDPVLEDSWRKILRHEPPMIYPGHGPAYVPSPNPLPPV